MSNWPVDGVCDIVTRVCSFYLIVASLPSFAGQKFEMNRITNWLNRIFSDCLGRRCAGHALLEECKDGADIGNVVELKRIPIIQTSPIFHLNDDCMLQIFSHLSLHDLASVSLTCQHFQVLAEYEFSQQNRNKQFTCCDAVVFGYAEVKDEERLSRALAIMKAFGRLIDTIIVFDIIYFRFLPLLQAEMNLPAWQFPPKNHSTENGIQMTNSMLTSIANQTETRALQALDYFDSSSLGATVRVSNRAKSQNAAADHFHSTRSNQRMCHSQREKRSLKSQLFCFCSHKIFILLYLKYIFNYTILS